MVYVKVKVKLLYVYVGVCVWYVVYLHLLIDGDNVNVT